MMGDPLDLLDETVGIQALDDFGHTGVEGPSPLMQERGVRDLVGQRVVERVFDVREQVRLVEEFGRLKARNSGSQSLVAFVRHGVQPRKGDVLADHRRGLQPPLVLGRKPIDPGSQHGLGGRGYGQRRDRTSQSVGAAVAG